MTVKAQYNGKAIVPLELEKIAKFKATLEDGAVLALTVERWDARRTVNQQRLLHGMLGALAREQGESLESVKVGLKIELGHYLPAAELLSGEVEAPKWRGAFVDLHTHRPHYYPQRTLVFLRSESDYTKRMEREFIDRVVVECAEAGVDVSHMLDELRSANATDTG